MVKPLPSINCKSFELPDKCRHSAAPHGLIRPARCVLVDEATGRGHADPRRPEGCKLCEPKSRPNPPPMPPRKE